MEHKSRCAVRSPEPGGFALREEHAYSPAPTRNGRAHEIEVFDLRPPAWAAAVDDPVPGFMQATLAYYREMERLEEAVSMLLSTALGRATGRDLPASFLSEGRGRHRGLLRLNWYPSRNGPARIVNGAHVDWTPFTLIYADQPGLELYHNESWTNVRTMPGDFTVLIGEQLHLWSNGIFRGAKHRVSVDTRAEPRLSIVYFGTEAIDVDDDIRIEPVCKAGATPKFAPVEIRSYVKTRFSALWPSA